MRTILSLVLASAFLLAFAGESKANGGVAFFRAVDTTCDPVGGATFFQPAAFFGSAFIGHGFGFNAHIGHVGANAFIGRNNANFIRQRTVNRARFIR